MSLSDALSIAMSGLRANQAAMALVSSNVANAETPGYVRKSVDQVTVDSGSSLESSNTDIADEFTKLIVTQQAYSANTKVITTANTMVQDLLNVMR